MKKQLHGHGLIELMICLAVTSLLMMAVFAAINTSFLSFRSNQAQGMLAIRGRAVLMRMLDHIRTTSAHQPITAAAKTAWQTSSSAVSDTGIKLAEELPDGATTLYYTYSLDASNASNKRLRMKREVYTNGSLSSTSDTVLLNGVTDFSITMWSGKSDPDAVSYDILSRAAIELEVAEPNKGLVSGSRLTGTNTSPAMLAFSGSVVPRQNAWKGAKLSASITDILNANQ